MHWLLDGLLVGLALVLWTCSREFQKLHDWQATRTEYWYQQCRKVQDQLFKERERRKTSRKPARVVKR
jgi:hypothetical protein